MLRFFKSGWSVLEIFQKICTRYFFHDDWRMMSCNLLFFNLAGPKCQKIKLPSSSCGHSGKFKEGWKPQQIYFCSTTLRIQTFLYCCTRRGCGRFNCFYLCSRTINGNILNQVQVGERKVFHECMNRSPKKNLSHRSITSSFSVVVIANCLSPLPTGWALTFISTMH